jgi:hypothetical protein
VTGRIGAAASTASTASFSRAEGIEEILRESTMLLMRSPRRVALLRPDGDAFAA